MYTFPLRVILAKISSKLWTARVVVYIKAECCGQTVFNSHLLVRVFRDPQILHTYAPPKTQNILVNISILVPNCVTTVSTLLVASGGDEQFQNPVQIFSKFWRTISKDFLSLTGSEMLGCFNRCCGNLIQTRIDQSNFGLTYVYEPNSPCPHQKAARQRENSMLRWILFFTLRLPFVT